MAHAVKTSAAADTREYKVRGRTVKVVARPPGRMPRLLQPQRPGRAGDVRISAYPVDPVSFSLPGTPDSLVLTMDDRGDGHLYTVGADRVPLGSDGMWWIVTRLIDALEDPQGYATQPRFLTLGDRLGGQATQASIEYTERGLCMVWRRLSSGVVEELLSWHELTPVRAIAWLKVLWPMVDELQRRGVHRHRLLPARTAENWACVLEGAPA
jgi:hypothetical protein